MLTLVLLVLAALLRSLVAPLLVATVVLSFSAALGACWRIFRYVLGFPALDDQALVFLVALGVDYNIFLVTRVREEVPRAR